MTRDQLFAQETARDWLRDTAHGLRRDNRSHVEFYRQHIRDATPDQLRARNEKAMERVEVRDGMPRRYAVPTAPTRATPQRRLSVGPAPSDAVAGQPRAITAYDEMSQSSQ